MRRTLVAGHSSLDHNVAHAQEAQKSQPLDDMTNVHAWLRRRARKAAAKRALRLPMVG
jgi:hypothetical protein